MQWDPSFAVQVFAFIILKEVIMTTPNGLLQLQYYTDISKMVLSFITTINRKIKEMRLLVFKLFKK